MLVCLLLLSIFNSISYCFFSSSGLLQLLQMPSFFLRFNKKPCEILDPDYFILESSQVKTIKNLLVSGQIEFRADFVLQVQPLTFPAKIE